MAPNDRVQFTVKPVCDTFVVLMLIGSAGVVNTSYLDDRASPVAFLALIITWYIVPVGRDVKLYVTASASAVKGNVTPLSKDRS